MPLPQQLQLSSFFNKQYDYFIEHDFCLYYEGRQAINYFHTEPIQLVYKDNYSSVTSILKHTANSIYIVKDKQQYISSLTTNTNKFNKKWKVESKEDNYPLYLSIKHIYKNYSEEQKTILSFFNGISDKPLNEAFEDWFDSFCSNKKEILALFKAFPKSTLDIHTIDLQKIDNYLNQKGFSFEETDKFFFNYFKVRENKLNLPENFACARDFLIEKYNGKEDLLTKYFDFFPALKTYFNSNITKENIFLSTPSLSTIVDLDYKKCMNSFFIDGWNQFNYRVAINRINLAIGEYFNIPDIKSIDMNGERQRLLFLHDNPKVNIELIQDIIVDYLTYNKINPDKSAFNKEVVLWLSHNLLSKKITSLDIPSNNNNKNKIKL